jgi:hypothetical protein
VKTIQQIYEERLTGNDRDQSADDIFTVLPTLRAYASRCKHITEIGVRKGNSASAFLCGLSDNSGGSYVGYDISAITFEPEWPAEIPGVSVKIHCADSANIVAIEPTDLLHIDGEHKWPHPLHDLSLSANVRRWIFMHDTGSRWLGGGGPRRARDEFLHLNHDKWALIHHCDDREGFSILERLNSQ